MILPQTFGAALLVLILGLICLGSWASAYKLVGKFRFELFYFDFALGAVVLAAICAFTVGNLGFDGFSFMDDLDHAGKKQWLFAFAAGVVFNLANMLLTSSVSVSGLTVAFPVAFATALTFSTVATMLGGPSGNPTLLLGGCGLLVLSIVVTAISFNMLSILRHESLARAGLTISTRRPSSMKGVILALVSGLLLGAYLPLLDKAREGEIGLGPFTLALLFSLGLFFSTFVFNVFFINLPVQGDPAEIGDYLKAGLLTHAKGIFAGLIFCSGMVALWVTAQTSDLLRESGALVYFLGQAAPLLAALWGMLAWRELREGDMRVKITSVLMLLLFAGGLALLALAQLHVPKPT
jgi:glucose uptake protein